MLVRAPTSGSITHVEVTHCSPPIIKPELTQCTPQQGRFSSQWHPEVQKKAQKELDAVVGTERLPGISDRPSLPYVNAVVKELVRWYPAAPLGSPHRVVADDEYNGYSIPGDVAIFVNIWFVLRSSFLTMLYTTPNMFLST